ncbi:MAG: PrsW family intramembrane metalloprotease [Acidobacteriia bacterium]|nr:PrsW family intramembrane metalloprotease [Terriglobia bacterium]
MGDMVRVAISLMPVFLFLVALFALDSFKLVRPGSLVRALLAGTVAGVACLLLARGLVASALLAPATYSRYLAPVTEECAKALFVVFLIRKKRVGFMVDAAIVGFATGAGFATVENLYYLLAVSDPNLLLWTVRGFGTAVLHGGTTAILGIVSKLLADIYGHERPLVFLPGFGVAVASHALFNNVVLWFPPLTFTLAILVSFPILILAVFARSERILREWLEVGFGSDVEILEMLRSGEVKETRIGLYLRTLRDRFPGEVLADMLCYLQMWVELSIKAKGRLLLREAGLPRPADPVIADRLAELAFLEKSIGVTGRLALAPFLHGGSRGQWEVEMLRQGGGQ